MVSIQGIGGIPEPGNSKPTQKRGGHDDVKTSRVTDDGVEISAQATQAAKAAQVVAQTNATSEIREERIAQAKENIEQGAYKLQEVVLAVASRISKYIS